ncbi:prephenate dehydrogenase [Streptomyces chartreusis]|uniref:prephenate dehydrogenase n=1 Tax=Streptomyces chartreusis TaxID=1969 RepID=UPI0037F12F50
MKAAVVIGTGLIGTSVALALSRRGVTVYLNDINGSAALTAEAMGAGICRLPDETVDLAVLAVPPGKTSEVLAAAQRAGLALAYTDVASVKARPYSELDSAGADRSRYIGGHPLVGAEGSGPIAGRGDLFEGRPWVLTPSAHSNQDVLNRVLELVWLCSSVPVVMDSRDHDSAVALTSHAPHILASLMAGRLAEATEQSLRICGQGLRNAVRTAGGSPKLWGEILEANAGAVADVLDAYATDLAQAIKALRALGNANPEECKQAADLLDEILTRGNRGLIRVAPGSGQHDLARVPAIIPDQPGALAELFAAVRDAGMNIEDVRIKHSSDRPRGFVELFVARASAVKLSRLLDDAGWFAPASPPPAVEPGPGA